MSIFSGYKCKVINAPVVVSTTSKTTTSGMFAVLADAAMSSGYMSAVLAGLRESRRHSTAIRSKTQATHQYTVH